MPPYGQYSSRRPYSSSPPPQPGSMYPGAGTQPSYFSPEQRTAAMPPAPGGPSHPAYSFQRPAGAADPLSTGAAGAPGGVDPFAESAAFSADPFFDSYGGLISQYGYNEQLMPEAMFQEGGPTFMLPDIMPGLDPMSPGYAMLANYPVDPLALYYMTGAAGTANGGPAEMAALYADMMGQAASGNVHVDFGQMLSQIMNAAPDSKLGMLMANNPTAIAGYMQSALADAARMSFDPLTAQVLDQGLSAAFVPMQNAMMKLSPGEFTSGAVDPTDYLSQGLSRLGFGF